MAEEYVYLIIPGKVPPTSIAWDNNVTSLPSFTITIDMSKFTSDLLKVISDLLKGVKKAITKPGVTTQPGGVPTVTAPGGAEVPLVKPGYNIVAIMRIDTTETSTEVSPGQTVTLSVKVEVWTVVKKEGEYQVVARNPVPGASVTIWDTYFNPEAPPKSKLTKYVAAVGSTDENGMFYWSTVMTDVGVHRFNADVEVPSPIKAKAYTNSVTVTVGATRRSREEIMEEYERWLKTQMAMAIATAMGSVVALAVAIYTALRKR